MKKNISNIYQIIKELNYILNSRQKIRMVAVLFVIIISSFFELLGVTAIMPFIQTILEPDKIMKQPGMQAVMDKMGITSSTMLLTYLGIGLILLYLIKNAYMIFSYYVQFAFSSRVQMELSNQMLRSYMKRPYEYYLDINSSQILRGCEGDVSGVYAILSDLLQILSELLSAALISIFLFVTDPIIASGVLMIMMGVLIVIVLFFKPVMKKIGAKYREVNAIKSKVIFQTVTGIKDIYVMQRKESFLNEYWEATDVDRKIARLNGTISNSPDRIVEGVCVSGIIGIVCARLLMSGKDMASFVSVLGVFAMAAFKLFPSVGKISGRITDIVYNRSRLTGVYENFKESDAFEKQQENYIQCHREADHQYTELHFQKEVVIHQIAWKYRNQKECVLKNVSLAIHKGESVGFIGSSGSGKTTLSDIILGLIYPQQGSVTMDGIDIYSIPQIWAGIVGYVPQSVFLIDDSVRNNIAFGTAKEDIKDEDIWDALEQAQLKEFISGLPEGLDTVVGERGIKFSGGQKQRIAIARALYHKPEILVLDEATAALDNETETAVMESIDALQGQITMLIVAHRLTTIRNCDKIYEIVNGEACIRNKEDVLKNA